MDTPPQNGTEKRRSRTWRLVTLVAFAAAGALLVTSALDADGADLRAASVTDLSTLVRAQRADTDAKQTRVGDLDREVDRLSRGVGDAEVRRLQRAAAKLEDPAGLREVSGPGVTVTLQDAPGDVLDQAIEDGKPSPETLVVHQQDIQAVVNALWLGGATAVSIQNQRIISTTGIKCAGPTVILHGVPYAPPYVIRAVGDPADLQAALDASDYIDAYRVFVRDYDLGYDVSQEPSLEVPGYRGTLRLRYAEPLATSG